MNTKRTVLILRGTSEQIARQATELKEDCAKRNWKVIKTFEEHIPNGEPLGLTTIHSVRGMAAYNEFDVLFLESKEALGSDSADTLDFCKYLNENGVSLVSSKEGILNLVVVGRN